MDIRDGRALGFTNYLEPVVAFDTLGKSWSGGNAFVEENGFAHSFTSALNSIDMM